MKENIKKFYATNWSTRDKILVSIILLLTGTIIGFLFSPIKKGFHCLSDIGSNNTSYGDEEEEEL